MDDLTPPRGGTVLRFRPDPRLTGLCAAAAAVAVGLSVTTGDGPGRVLFAIAAVVLGGYAVSDLVFSPRLVADASGLLVRAPAARARLSWPEIEEVRADVRHRYGLRSVTLEIDAGERLIVLSGRALGAAPDRVAGLVRALDPRGPGQPSQ